jgi:outer membrane protein TolC
MLIVSAAVASAQEPPAPVVSVTLPDAIARAQSANPSVAAVAAGILRAEGLLQQARSASRFQLSGNITTTTLNTGVEFQDTVVTPRNQIAASLTADQPIIAASAWARRAQAEDAKGVADLALADTKRFVAFATADAYLTVIAQRRLVEGQVRARDTAKAHFDLASELERQGSGSRLNVLRAQQQYSTDLGLVESARLAVYRAQEALGVLIVANGPADAAGEPVFELPDAAAPPPPLVETRTDLKLLSAQRQAAERVVYDSSKDWWPTLDAIFQPSSVYPSQFFLPQNSWRLLLQANVPIFDAGQRVSQRLQRSAAVDQASAALRSAVIAAESRQRAARAAVASGTRGLASARDAADQARQVVDITNISFRAGAATNIEVIDAERSARDADMAAAVAEDALRRARLELLDALGRFPQ